MKISLHTSTLALLVSIAPLGAVAHAQPDTNNAPKAENPANRAPRARRPQGDMTPEARMKWFAKRMYSALGANEATQETLATFTQNEMKARQDLAAKGQPLQNALRAGALSNTQVAALLNSYQGALEDEKVRRAKAIADLEKVVDFKKSPKIEAALTLAGLIGDGPMMTGNMGRGMGVQAPPRVERGQNGRGNGRRNRPNTPNKAPAQGA